MDWVKSPGSCPYHKKMLKKRNFQGSPMIGMKTQRRAAMTKLVYA